MSLKIAVLKEKDTAETRVAAVPEVVKKLTALGCDILIEKAAGADSCYSDDEYKAAGANIVSADKILKSADILLCVRAPSEAIVKKMKKGALLIGGLDSYDNQQLISFMAKSGITSFAMELMPRITRAQAMDILSSQSNLAGYKAVLDAAEYYKASFPMMMTAAGTVPPAKVFVMGAGVAGLQAIATAKRLGAIVSATDVRPAAKEQVESLGATFIAVEDEEFKEAETAGGYAKEMSKSYQKKQQKLIEETIAKQDIVITTALIPGRPAPELVTEKMIKSMKAGSVIVDLAVERGGNVALSEFGKIVNKHDVSIIGHANVAGRLPNVASSLFSRNLLNLLNLIIDKDSASLKIDFEDEIIKGICLTNAGKIVHENFKSIKTTAKKKATKAKSTSKKSATKKKTTTKKKTMAKKKATAKKATVN